MYFAKSLAASAGIFSLASAHMLLADPKPFTSGVDTSNGPLDPSGSNFPCKATGGSMSGPSTQYALGSKQSVDFTGSAVHGGGSCQLSVTYDTNPTKNSKWKVIHSIEGGCPARNTPGNLGNDPNMVGKDKYEFTVPSIPAGKATFGWTWNNVVGNREFYMNCASIELTGTGGSQSTYDSLPDMLVVNLAGVSSCTIAEGLNLEYPNPGSSLEKNGGSFGKPQNCPASGGGSGGGGSGSAPGSSAPAAPQPTTSAAATSKAAASPTGGAPGGIFITTGGAAGPVATPTPTPTPTKSAAVSASAMPSVVAPGPGSGSGAGMTGACSPEGLWNCLAGGKQFQQCGSGQWSAVMNVAAGTSCTPGQSSSLKMAAVGKKRWIKAFRA